MKYCIKIVGIILGALITTNCQADTEPTRILDIRPYAKVGPHKEGKITLDELHAGAVYTVSCDISNTFYAQYPTVSITTSNSNLHLPPIFFINNIQGNEMLDQRTNKYTAKHVMRVLWGEFISIKNNSDHADIWIIGCSAMLDTDE